MKEETWKSVIGHESRFEISSYGRLRNLSGKILSQKESKTGYLCHSTRVGGRGGKCVLLRVHRLVACSFLGQPTQEQLLWAESSVYGVVLVNHKDCDKKNNHHTNLEWATAKENSKHALENGLVEVASGLCNKLTKFSSKTTLEEIRSCYAEGSSARAVGEIFSCSKDVVRSIVNKTGAYKNT